MNKTESSGVGALAGVLTMVLSWVIWTWYIFEYFMIVADHLRYSLYGVEHEVYWLAVGFFLLWGMRTASNIYHYARRGDKV